LAGTVVAAEVSMVMSSFGGLTGKNFARRMSERSAVSVARKV
jgi:hypothetical protein